MTTFMLTTLVTRLGGRGVIIPAGNFEGWTDVTPCEPAYRDVQVALTTPTGDTVPLGTERAYRLRDGDWLLPFVSVREPGTIVSATDG